MFSLTSEQSRVLADAVATAAGRAELAEAVDAVHAEVQRAIDERRPRCDVSGRCCRFEQFGHRLFVTTLELAVFVGRLKAGGGGAMPAGWDGTGCPFQAGKLCGAHLIRPFGCRIFFCDPAADVWQQAQYERFHAAIKALHERFGVPYLYVEWREGLKAVLQDGGTRPTVP